MQMEVENGNLNAIQKETDHREQLNHILLMEEIYWRQKSRIKWLKDGDANTKFFHESVKSRRRRNKINVITVDGQKLEEEEDIRKAFHDHLSHLLSKGNETGRLSCKMREGKTVTAAENVSLLAPISEEEIIWVVKGADPDSAPGPDGFPNKFYIQNWEIVKEDIQSYVRDFFAHGRLVRKVNRTHIVVIPKSLGDHNIENFRPISLCNSTTKFLSRIMVRRMRPILCCIIDANQNAFLAGRCIQDSILLAQEVVHSMEARKCKSLYMKIDFSKAYDRVSWEFLENAMQELGFDPIWVQKVMTLVRTVSMTVVLNSKEGNWFFPQRGLRQGDPLSPYFFLIIAEMFTRSLKHVINNKQVKLPTIGKDRSGIDSLFYADDLLMFVAFHMKSLKTIKGIFQDLENCLGLTLNKDKSTIIGINTSPIELSKAARILEWQDGQLPFKYLGVPLQNKRLVDNQCSRVLLRIDQKLGSWKNKLLSYTGRICLIRALSTNNMWATYVRKKYLKEHGLWRAMSFTKSSILWKDIVKSWKHIKDKVGWHIKDGTRAKFWIDSWTGRPLAAVIDVNDPISEAINTRTTVREVMCGPNQVLRDTVNRWRPDIMTLTMMDNQVDTLAWTNHHSRDFGRPSGCIRKLKSGDSIYGLDMDYQGLLGQSTSDAMAES
ncbi:retrotransposable element ORF2 protein [Nymphaea thermarum]|nr:retrotransposable element ORF2 protein [Nymphaea thermarum]